MSCRRRRIYRGVSSRTGSVTIARTIPQLKTFVEQGGTVIAIGSSTSVAGHFRAARLGRSSSGADGSSQPLPRSKFYVPGRSAGQRRQHDPARYGFDAQVDVFFDDSPTFAARVETRRPPGVDPWPGIDTDVSAAQRMGVGSVVPERGTAAIVDAPLGKGTRAAVRTGDHVPRAVARHVQVPVQRNLLRRACLRRLADPGRSARYRATDCSHAARSSLRARMSSASEAVSAGASARSRRLRASAQPRIATISVRRMLRSNLEGGGRRAKGVTVGRRVDRLWMASTCAGIVVDEQLRQLADESVVAVLLEQRAPRRRRHARIMTR